MKTAAAMKHILYFLFAVFITIPVCNDEVKDKYTTTKNMNKEIHFQVRPFCTNFRVKAHLSPFVHMTAARSTNQIKEEEKLN